MFSNLTRNKCPLCSRLSSGVKSLISGLFGNKNDCQDLNKRTHDIGKSRVAEINTASPDCGCEKYRMSEHSPNVVGDDEMLARFVFSPMHVNKKGEIKPSIFSHVFNNGCSIQRESIATSEELINFAKNFLISDEKYSWEGVLLAKCDDIRDIKASNKNNRAVCVYDTAEPDNRAHGEMAQTQYIIEEADQAELRYELFQAFGKGVSVHPNKYREGAIWAQLPDHLQRSVGTVANT